MVSAVMNSRPQKCNSDKTIEELGTDLAERFQGSVDGATFKGRVDGKEYSVDIQLVSREDTNSEEL